MFRPDAVQMKMNNFYQSEVTFTKRKRDHKPHQQLHYCILVIVQVNSYKLAELDDQYQFNKLVC